jgi:hypothetical protein
LDAVGCPLYSVHHGQSGKSARLHDGQMLNALRPDGPTGERRQCREQNNPPPSRQNGNEPECEASAKASRTFCRAETIFELNRFVHLFCSN